MKLIKLERQGCNPCKLLDFILDDFGVTPDEKYDLMLHPEVIDKYNVMKVPMLILVDDNGNEIERLAGTDEDAVKAFLERAGII